MVHPSILTEKIHIMSRHRFLDDLTDSIQVSNDGSVEKWMHLIIRPLRGPGSISDCGGVFQNIFPWLITRGCKQKVS